MNEHIERMVEGFAEMEHRRWSNWQSYLHSICTKNEDGSLTIPASFVIHWERQISTPYSQLTEREKESDRQEVRPYTEALTTYGDTRFNEGLERAKEVAGELPHFTGGSSVNEKDYRINRQSILAAIEKEKIESSTE